MLSWCACSKARKGGGAGGEAPEEKKDADAPQQVSDDEKEALREDEDAAAAGKRRRRKKKKKRRSGAAATRSSSVGSSGDDDDGGGDEDERTFPKSSLKRSESLESKRVRFSDVSGDEEEDGETEESESESGGDEAAAAVVVAAVPAAAEAEAEAVAEAEAEEPAKEEPPAPEQAAPPAQGGLSMSPVPEGEEDASSSPSSSSPSPRKDDESADKVAALKPNIHHKKFQFSEGRLEDRYEVTDTVLGSGAFGTVNLAYLLDGDDGPEDMFAVKSVNKGHRLLKSGEFMHEVDILSKVSHENVITLRDTYDTPSHIHLVMEYAGGGELFDRIIDERKFEERRVREIVVQLTDAIAYLHAQGITHRDLKPENILFETHDSDRVKVSDFGFAQALNNAESMMQVMKKRGTMGYAAPEIFSGRGYDEKCDVWSLGIIVYIMLAGIPPFSPMDDFTVESALDVAFWKHASRMKKVPEGPVEFPEAYFLGVSEQAKDWLRCALELDPIQRARSIDLLRHPWLKANDRLNQTTVLSQAVVGRLKNMYSSLR